jgi:hypothetical protein
MSFRQAIGSRAQATPGKRMPKLPSSVFDSRRPRVVLRMLVRPGDTQTIRAAGRVRRRRGIEIRDHESERRGGAG